MIYFESRFVVRTHPVGICKKQKMITNAHWLKLYNSTVIFCPSHFIWFSILYFMIWLVADYQFVFTLFFVFEKFDFAKSFRHPVWPYVLTANKVSWVSIFERKKPKTKNNHEWICGFQLLFLILLLFFEKFLWSWMVTISKFYIFFFSKLLFLTCME